MGVDFRSTERDDSTTSGKGRRLGIVCARWNDAITRRMLRGVWDEFAATGVDAADVELVWVPGAFEIPLAAREMAATGRFDAVITLGCVIRGDTAHFEYVAGPAAEGILRAQLDTGVPIVFGVLTVENRRQALVRSVVDGDVRGDNKGAEAALTALQMVDALEAIRNV
uniref:6,7-dimethyl-8-ribityllumazine synthase n=1 Tax=uncultured bacterium A1Q1_fos_862 TaxID=1256590 RepID=L7VTR4_9BACT|nr:6,7-dimethyl-8-ribityllumazine synthase [uncultured bacterium A1Q1_fos_862]